MSRSLGLDSVSDDELLQRLAALVDRHRRRESELVAHIAEVDRRKLYLARACSSMFAYCVEVLHLSEHETYLRITSARASRRVPELLDMLADGRLHLSAIAKLAPHLSEKNAEALLGRAVHKTKRQIEELVAEVAPRSEVPSRMRKLPLARSGRGQLGPDRVPGATAPAAARSPSSAPATTSPPVTSELLGPDAADPVPAQSERREASASARAVLEPIAPARYKVAFTASAELHGKLCRAQALLRHKIPDGDLAKVVEEAVTLLLGKLEGRRFGKTDAPHKTLAETDTSATSRHVPAAVKRVVFERDGARCAFVDQATGRRCSCTDPGKLEYHHTTPFALGCDHDPDRIELRCRAHNQHQAELDFGRETVERHRRGTDRAREPHARYGPRPETARTERRLARSRQAESPRSEPLSGSPAFEDKPVVEAPRAADLRGAAGPPPGDLYLRGGCARWRARVADPPTASLTSGAPTLIACPRVGGATSAARAGWGSPPSAPRYRSLAD